MCADQTHVGDESSDDEGNKTTGAEGGDDKGNKPGIGRRKINIEFIEDKGRRHITFSKRKAGIMKKAYELSTLTGTQVLLLVASETGHVYTFSTPKLQPMITKPEGKNLIQACLNAPDSLVTPPPARIGYGHDPNNNNVAFQGGSSADAIPASYEEYDKDDKERRRLTGSYKGAIPGSYPPTGLDSSLAGHHIAPSISTPLSAYPSGAGYPGVDRLMPHGQYPPQQQNMYASPLTAVHPGHRYLPGSAGTPGQLSYGAHSAEASQTAQYAQYPPGYPPSYWTGGNVQNAAPPAEKISENAEASSALPASSATNATSNHSA